MQRSARQTEICYHLQPNASLRSVPAMKSAPRFAPLATSAAIAATVLAGAPSALAQDKQGAGAVLASAGPLDAGRTETRFIAEAGITGQGKADIDGGGAMQVTRFDAGLALTARLTDNTRLASAFLTEISEYDFQPDGFGDPWGGVIFNRASAQISRAVNDAWSVRGGGVLMSSRETGAGFGDSLAGGGMLGADYRHSQTLSFSFGAAWVSQLGDDPEVAPMLGFNWNAGENWTLRLGAIPSSGGAGPGIEAEYKLGEQLTLGLGLLYSERRFRLDDSGPAPDGIGREDSVPLRARLGWKLNEKASIHFIAGIALGGEVRLEDRSGSRLAKRDYDPAPYLAVRALLRF